MLDLGQVCAEMDRKNPNTAHLLVLNHSGLHSVYIVCISKSPTKYDFFFLNYLPKCVIVNKDKN